jgi:hypothetical protein
VTSTPEGIVIGLLPIRDIVRSFQRQFALLNPL